MKNIIIGMLALSSVSAFAGNIPMNGSVTNKAELKDLLTTFQPQLTDGDCLVDNLTRNTDFIADLALHGSLQQLDFGYDRNGFYFLPWFTDGARGTKSYLCHLK